MQRPTITQAQYDAIMPLQPADMIHFEALLRESYLGREGLCHRLGSAVYNAVMMETTQENLPITDRYSLAEARPRDEDELNSMTFNLQIMIVSPRNGLSKEERDDLVWEFLNYTAAIEKSLDFSLPIQLFRIAN